MTIKAFENRKRLEEKRNSRIKEAKKVILNNNLSGILNNTKWYKLFSLLEENEIAFEVYLITESSYRRCDLIRELEDTSILIDNSGDFIEFTEIMSVQFANTESNISLLENLNFGEYIQKGKIVIEGYR